MCSSGVMIGQDELLITGGIDEDGRYLKRSETLTTNEIVEGPDIPIPTSLHCMTSAGNGNIHSTGGMDMNYDNYPTPHAYCWVLENHFKSGWKNCSNLNQARYRHACGSFILHSATFLVVAGGIDEQGNDLNTIEFLSLAEETATWVYG